MFGSVLFLHPGQAQNTSPGLQGQEATAVAVINWLPAQVYAKQQNTNETIVKNKKMKKMLCLNN